MYKKTPFILVFLMRLLKKSVFVILNAVKNPLFRRQFRPFALLRVTFWWFFSNLLIFSLFAFSEAEDTREKGITHTAGGENAVYLTLEEVSRLALENNFDIQLARFDAQFKDEDLDNAQSIYDTVITLVADYESDKREIASSLLGTESETRNYNLGLSRKLPTGTTMELDLDNERYWTNSPFATVNPVYDSSLGLTLKQELGRNFFGIIDRSNIKITKIDIENSNYTSLDKIEETLSQVQKAYWELAKQMKAVRIREEMLARAKELFAVNQGKIQKGIIETPQLLASEANLKQREIDLILAENEREFHINKLKLLLNLENKDKVILPGREIDLVLRPVLLAESLKTAFANRRDYIRAGNETNAKEIKLVMKNNNLRPEINLEASVKKNNLDDHLSRAIEDIEREDHPQYFFSLKAEFPFENRKAKSELNKAKLEKAKALVNLKKIEYEILIEIKDKVRDCNVLEQRAKKQESVMNLQKEKLAAELTRYEYGRSDTDTVIRYQDDLLASELLYAEALLDYKEAVIELALKENILLESFWGDKL